MPSSEAVSDGTVRTRSVVVSTLARVSWFCDTAVMVMGTSWMFSRRFSAVTTISETLVGAFEVCAAQAPEAVTTARAMPTSRAFPVHVSSNPVVPWSIRWSCFWQTLDLR